MSWASRYVGIPQADHGRSELGCDCWGLARLVYARELKIDLPSYTGDYASSQERAEIAALVGTEETNGTWRPVLEIRAFDLLLFRRGRYRSHIGVAVDARLMLHMDGQSHSCLVRFADAPSWSARFCGAFRHAEMEQRT